MDCVLLSDGQGCFGGVREAQHGLNCVIYFKKIYLLQWTVFFLSIQAGSVWVLKPAMYKHIITADQKKKISSLLTSLQLGCSITQKWGIAHSFA